MLQHLHDHTKGVIAWVLIGVLALAFASFGISYYLNAQGASTTVATVNGTKIDAKQLDVSYKRLVQQFEQQFEGKIDLTPTLSKSLKQQALQQLIQAQVVTQAVAKRGLRIADAQLESVIKAMPAFQDEGVFSAERYTQALNQAGYSKEQFLGQMRTQMIVDQYKEGLSKSAFVLPGEVSQAIQLLEQTRKIRYALIANKHFMAKTKVSKTDIKNYYEEHPQDFQIPARIKLAYIELNLADFVKKTKITDKQAYEYYQANLRSYQPPAEWRAAHISLTIPKDAKPKQVAALKAKLDSIAQQIKQGGNFAKLAQQNSDDALSAQEGGRLPWITEGMLKNSRFEKTALNLKKNQVSEPIRTKYGYSLIKLIDIKRPARTPFVKVKNEIHQRLVQQQAQQNFTAVSEQLSNLIYMQPNSLKETADNLSLSIKTSGWVSPNKASGILNSPQVLQAAFTPEVAEQGLNSNVIQLTPEHLLVLRKSAYDPAKAMPLVKVRAQIKVQLQQAQAKQLAQQQGEKLSGKLKTGKSIDTDLKALGVSWKTASITQKASKTVPSTVIEAAFALPSPSVKEKVKPSAGKSARDSFVLVQLEQVQLADPKKLSDRQREAWKQQLSQVYGDLDYSLYIKTMESKAKIKKS